MKLRCVFDPATVFRGSIPVNPVSLAINAAIYRMIDDRWKEGKKTATHYPAVRAAPGVVWISEWTLPNTDRKPDTRNLDIPEDIETLLAAWYAKPYNRRDHGRDDDPDSWLINFPACGWTQVVPDAFIFGDHPIREFL